MATAHIIHGYLGSGKSTYARQLASAENAVLISMDDWYLQLFADGAPTAEQDYEALDRLSVVMDEHWPRILRAGASVVLDFGFWTRQSRDGAKSLAEAAGAIAIVYWVRCDDSVALARCEERNRTGSRTFLIDRRAFTALKDRYEQLGADEPARVVDTTEQ
jgi:predicted kinase